MRLALLLLVLGFNAALAQELPTPLPTSSPSPAITSSPEPSAPRARRVPLRFALPPLEGTISLGIYDANGRLVRVLHREDESAEFTPGHDALETSWDGTDDNG